MTEIPLLRNTDERQFGVEIEMLEKISSIHKPTQDPVEKYDPEELLEKLDYAVITARNALGRAVMPGEMRN
ncbi:MAG TPA: hypothetical protein VFE51_31395 [Verrucomicrobiae bacterium]|nr:hypothetical protein [Verrucomicrobiae bacterium]